MHPKREKSPEAFCFKACADGGTRTRTPVRAGDFKSPVSAIPPHPPDGGKYTIFPLLSQGLNRENSRSLKAGRIRNHEHLKAPIQAGIPGSDIREPGHMIIRESETRKFEPSQRKPSGFGRTFKGPGAMQSPGPGKKHRAKLNQDSLPGMIRERIHPGRSARIEPGTVSSRNGRIRDSVRKPIPPEPG